MYEASRQTRVGLRLCHIQTNFESVYVCARRFVVIVIVCETDPKLTRAQRVSKDLPNCLNSFFISRVSGADIGLPLYLRPSVLGGQNLRFTPVPVIIDWNHSGCRHP